MILTTYWSRTVPGYFMSIALESSILRQAEKLESAVRFVRQLCLGLVDEFAAVNWTFNSLCHRRSREPSDLSAHVPLPKVAQSRGLQDEETRR